VGSFTGTLTGAKDTTYQGSTAGGTVEFFGSCDDDVPLRVGFNVSDGDGVQVARFQGRTNEILEAGGAAWWVEAWRTAAGRVWIWKWNSRSGSRVVWRDERCRGAEKPGPRHAVLHPGEHGDEILPSW
jgi:hypothetical protein